MFPPQNITNKQNQLIHSDNPNNSNPSSSNNWYPTFRSDVLFRSQADRRKRSPFHRLSPPSRPSEDRPHPRGRGQRGPLSPSARCVSRLRNVVVRGRRLSGQSHARGPHAVCLCCEEVPLVTGPRCAIGHESLDCWCRLLGCRCWFSDSGADLSDSGVDLVFRCEDVTPSVRLLDLVSGWYQVVQLAAQLPPGVCGGVETLPRPLELPRRVPMGVFEEGVSRRPGMHWVRFVFQLC